MRDIVGEGRATNIKPPLTVRRDPRELLLLPPCVRLELEWREDMALMVVGFYAAIGELVEQ